MHNSTGAEALGQKSKAGSFYIAILSPELVHHVFKTLPPPPQQQVSSLCVAALCYLAGHGVTWIGGPIGRAWAAPVALWRERKHATG